jgi:hypothetical protein
VFSKKVLFTIGFLVTTNWRKGTSAFRNLRPLTYKADKPGQRHHRSKLPRREPIVVDHVETAPPVPWGGRRSALYLLLMSLLLPCVESLAQEWTRFRCPNGSGISAATNFHIKWTADDYNWQIDLPMMGSSSPVLWGKRLYLMGDHADNQQRSVLCINADSGRILWRRDYPVKRHRLHRDNDFTSATPCVDEHGVILVWSSPEQLLVTALSLDGKKMWQRELGTYKGLHGSSNSPILAGGMVVLANDQMDPKRFAWYLPKGTNMDSGKSFLIDSTGRRARRDGKWTEDRSWRAMRRPASAVRAVGRRWSSQAPRTASRRSI